MSVIACKEAFLFINRFTYREKPSSIYKDTDKFKNAKRELLNKGNHNS